MLSQTCTKNTVRNDLGGHTGVDILFDYILYADFVSSDPIKEPSTPIDSALLGSDTKELSLNLCDYSWMSPEILPIFTLLVRMSKKVVLPHPEGSMMANIRPLEDFSVTQPYRRRYDIEERGWW